MKLFSYCLKNDSGAAPNPYWGICSLVICKPNIRKTANIGDWIVGIGSANSPIGDISDCIVYAMKVTGRKKMKEYDHFCRKHLTGKLPDWKHKSYAKRVGDCIYDYSASGNPGLRKSVHNEGNRDTDLSGEYALLSEYFWYFGDKPVRLPTALLPIRHPYPGHKSNANDPYVFDFIKWIESLPYQPNKIHGEPQIRAKIGGNSCEGDWVKSDCPEVTC